MTLLVNQLFMDGGVCRTALATPGLLIILYLTDSVELGQSYYLIDFFYIYIYKSTLFNNLKKL